MLCFALMKEERQRGQRHGSQAPRGTHIEPERVRPIDRPHQIYRNERPRLLQDFSVPSTCTDLLDTLPSVLDEIIPLNQRHRQQLPHDVRRLWEDLTSEKQHRFAEYLGTPAYSSAYCRYFLPWNILRLASVLKTAPLTLKSGAVILDFGSGPLTFPIALYAARPELRKIPLTLYCADRTQRILAIGKAIFESLCAKLDGELPPWKIILTQLPFGSPASEKVDLLAEANMFNEFFWKGEASLGARATQTAGQLLSYLKDSGTVFLMEPGDPRSGAFISAMRAALAAQGVWPVAPCPHWRACPMPGFFRSLGAREAEAQDFGDDGGPGVGREKFARGADARTAKLRAEGPRDIDSRAATIRTEPSQAAFEVVGRMQSVVMPKWRTKYPWCHFTLDTKAAPPWLEDLSCAAGLPKEKLVLSYLLAGRQLPEQGGLVDLRGRDARDAAETSDRPGASMKLRVISGSFPLPGKMLGCYACSQLGFTLLTWPEQACKASPSRAADMPAARRRAQKHGADVKTARATKDRVAGNRAAKNDSVEAGSEDGLSAEPASGDLLAVISGPAGTERRRDEKTGAVVISI